MMKVNEENMKALEAALRDKEAERHSLERALVLIQSNAASQLHAQALAGIQEDAPEAINARFNYRVATDALLGMACP